MALIKGMLVAYSETVRNVPPTVVVFQYNPAEMTRVLRVEREPEGEKGSSALNAKERPVEEYSLTLEFDATDGLERGGPLTTAFGISPRLAALELLMQPLREGVLGPLRIRPGTTIPASRLPLVLFVWGPGRVTPVTMRSLQITESAFDELLNPIHATAQLSFTVIREDDLADTEQLAIGAARNYQKLRERKAALQVAQMPELMRVPQQFPDPADVLGAVATAGLTL